MIPLQDDISHRIMEFIFGVQSTTIPTQETFYDGWRERLNASNERTTNAGENDK